ncbi:hypothetical protein OS42_47500 [Dickeya oryzae]
MWTDIYQGILQQGINPDLRKDYFPIHDLPQDACFVIRHTELEKLIDMPTKKPNILVVFHADIHAVIPIILARL